MAKPTADTDKELIQQLKNLKAEMIDRMTELDTRGYDIEVTRGHDMPFNFAVEITKTIHTNTTI